jgi:hypothetical protein
LPFLSDWIGLGTGVQRVSKGRNGLIDIIMSDGSVYEHTGQGSFYLTNGAVAAVKRSVSLLSPTSRRRS